MNENSVLDDDDVAIASETSEHIVTYSIESQQAGERIDKWLSSELPELSRSQIQLYIQSENITVNQQPVKANYKLRVGDCVTLAYPEAEEVNIQPENISLDIVYEDGDLVVVNKPRGMVVHPAQGHYSGTLVNALLFHCRDLSGINGKMRPGIVHRIDKDTTGLLVVAKNDLTHQHLAEQFKEHSIIRKYVALVHGLVPNQEGTIIAPLGRHQTQRKKMAVDVANGKHAVTHFKVIQYFTNHSLVELRLETGRTHQIRVHMAYIKHPVAGDPDYGPRKTVPLAGQALHAKELGFIHPRTGERLFFTSDIPEDFQQVLATLS